MATAAADISQEALVSRPGAQAASTHSTGVQSDDSSVVDHVNEKKAAAPVALSKREKLKRHCGRFWWWYVLLVLVVLIIMIPLIFTVIIPAIVQDIVSHQGLPIHQGVIKAVAPDQIILTLNTTLNTPLSVTLDPLKLTLSRDAAEANSPVTEFTLPAMKAQGLTDVVLDAQPAPVLDLDKLTGFIGNLFDQKTVELYVQGNPSIHLNVLHKTTTLKKSLELPALNGLEGKSIDNLTLMLDKDSEGHNLVGKLNLPNAGVITLDIGNLTLDLTSGPLKIGNVTLLNVVLTPGPNPVDFKGVLDIRALVQGIGTVLSSQAQALSRGDIDLNATATSVKYNGVTIPYLQNVLNKRTLTFSINVVTLLADVVGGLLHTNTQGLGDLVDEIVGNKTLIAEVNSHWNTSEALNIGANNNKRRRLASREALTWEMIKLGMKMNRNRF